MKINSIFRSLFFPLLTMLLLLSSPLATPAQQISAEVQAKRDAEADLDKLLLIGNSFAIPVLPTLGVMAGSLLPQSYSSSGFAPSCEQTLGICVGLTFAYLGPITLIRRHQPTPPTERFIGKSPEYIAVYTEVYETRTGRLRTQYIAVGGGIGCGVVAIIGQIAASLE